MRLSIIIPVFNEAEHIVAHLQQLKASQRGEYEIIVVDGGSSDNSPELARQYADKLVIAAKGRAVQMNAGAAKASADVLLFLHADTILPENIADFLVSIDRAWGWFDVRLSGRHCMFRVIERMMNLRSRLTSVATGDQALFVKRALFDEVGGYPEIALMEDVALSKLLRTQARPVILKQQVITSSRRWQRRGVFKTIMLMWYLRLLYFFGISPVRLEKIYR